MVKTQTQISEISETSMVNDDQVPPSNSKTYTQHNLYKLRSHWEEQFKLQKAIDKKFLEKEIQNHYLHQIQSLKSEHQEQLATIASEIAAHKDSLVTADAQKAHDIHTIQMFQQRIKLLEGANQTQADLAMPRFDPLVNYSLLYNQSLVHNSLVNMIDKFDKSLNMQTATLKQTSTSAKEYYISSTKTYDGKDCKEFNNWLESVYRLSRISDRDLIEVALATSTGPLHKHISEFMALGIDSDVIKNKVQERFSEFGTPLWHNQNSHPLPRGQWPCMNTYLNSLALLNMPTRSNLVTLAAICWQHNLFRVFPIFTSRAD